MTRKQLEELKLERAKIVKQMRDLNERTDAEGQPEQWSADDQTNFDRLDQEQTRMGQQIDREERLLALEGHLDEPQRRGYVPDADDGSDGGGDRSADPEYQRRALERFLRSGIGVLDAGERRALQADSDEAGGYLVAPEQVATELIKAIDDQVFIRGLSNVQSVVTADSLGAPSLDADPADSDWTSEIATGNEDSTMDFGKRNLEPHPLAKRIKVSNTLIRKTSQGVVSLVIDRLSYKFAITEEKAFLTGHGSGQPLGIFTASSDGISTSRDVNTGNTSSAIGADNLIECKYALKGGYWGRSQWVFHRDAMKQVALLKDGDNRYLWSGSLVAGDPDTVLGRPVNMSEYAPNTFTTGLYVGILGDFSRYWIADALTIQIQRLNELYAETNQTGFIGRLETDGMPVLEEAFVRSTLA